MHITKNGREEGKQYVPYSHMMVGVYSLWKTSDGFLQLRKKLTAKKKQPPSRAMDEPYLSFLSLRGEITRCLHWSTSLGEDGLLPIGGSKKRYSARSGRDPAVNEEIHWRDHHTFYSRRTGKSMMSEPSPGPLCKPIILIRPSLVTKKKPPKKSIAEQP